MSTTAAVPTSSSIPTLFGTTASSSSIASVASAAPSSQGNSSTTNVSSPGEPIVLTQEPIFQCVPASYNFTGGTPPYTSIYIIESGLVNASILKTLPPSPIAETASWGVDISKGTSITFVVVDSLNITGYSAPVVIQTSNDSSCLPKRSGTSAGTIAGAVVGGLGGALLLGAAIWFFFFRNNKIGGSKGKEAWYPDEDELKRTPTGSDIGLTPQGASALHRRPTGTFNLQQVDFNADSLEPMVQAQNAALPTYSEAYNGRTRLPGEAREVEGTQ